MSPEKSLRTLLEEIEALASKVHERCTHASTDFETAILDITRLRATLKEVIHEVSKPESKIQYVDGTKREELGAVVDGCRPLLEHLENLVTKDQGLKKKRIWKRDKDNTPALDHIHRQLDFRRHSLNLYLSTLRSSQLALIEKKLETFVEEFKRGGREASRTSNSADQESALDVQWSVLRHELAEDGITDTDIEVHKSSIRALLQEQLPSYYDAQSASSPEEVNKSLNRLEGSHQSIRGFLEGEPSDGLFLNEDKNHQVRQPCDVDPDSLPNNPQAMFYIADSTDSETEAVHHNEKFQVSESRPRLSMTDFTTQLSSSQHFPAEIQCTSCHQVFSQRSALNIHERASHFWSCGKVMTYEAGYFGGQDISSVDFCGYCGEMFEKISRIDWARRKGHMKYTHRWNRCDREKKFYQADDFHQHLVDAHHAIPGWWSNMLLRVARHDANSAFPTDAPSHHLRGRDSKSLSHRSSLASREKDVNPRHDDCTGRRSSNMSHTSSMHRIHSDVSEYDAHDNLTRRTITTSYSSLPDVAAAAVPRNQSSPVPQSQTLSTVQERALPCRTTSGRSPTAPAHGTTKRNLHSPVRPEFPGLIKRDMSESHLRTRHPDWVVSASRTRKYTRLKRGYRKRIRQLRLALQLLNSENVERPTPDERQSAAGPDWITETLRDLDLDSLPSSSEDSQDGFASSRWFSSDASQPKDDAQMMVDVEPLTSAISRIGGGDMRW